MTELTREDFDNLFHFYTVINSDYSNYENIVLFSLSTIFKIQLAGYGVVRMENDGSKRVERFFSSHIRREILNQYKKEYFADDLFLQQYSQLCYAYPNSACFTDDLLQEYGGQMSTKYGAFLRSHNIAHEAMLGVNGSGGSRVPFIKVYKTQEDGPFTAHEKELLEHIGKAFNSSKALYYKYAKQQRKLEAVTSYFDELDFGFALIDEKGRLLHHNATFLQLSSNLSPGLTKAEIAKDIVLAITGTAKLPNENYYKEEARVNGLILTLQKKRITLSQKTEHLYFITLREDKREPSSEISSVMLSSHYGLTRREAEVALLITKGYNNQEISDELFIGTSTVKTHISSIYSKMMVNSRTEMLKKLRNDDSKKMVEYKFT